jgi:predicted enzyme related to lactoylglutathione lyase
MPAVKTRGRFVWYELSTSDPAAAQGFYKKIMGWGTEDFPETDSSTVYTMLKNGDTPIGGLWQLPAELASQGVPPNWLPYISTDDVDETVGEATQLGARVVVPPKDIPNMGRFAVLADPQGAMFALYKSTQEMPDPEFNPQLGEGSWHELTTSDHVAAYEFYNKLFGWEKQTEMDMGGGAMYMMYGRTSDSPMLGGMWTAPPGQPIPPSWMIYFKVEDADQTAERIKQLGGQIVNGPMEVPGGDRVAQAMDPQGAMFGIHSSAKK